MTDPIARLRDDRKLIERIDKYGKGLSPREIDFIESCAARLANRELLSDAQRKWALDIDESKVP